MVKSEQRGTLNPADALPPEVRELYPFEARTLELAAGRMSYLDEGPRDAPAILMVHGNPSWSFFFRSLVLALRGRFRCVVPDHLGCGLSDKPASHDYCLSTHIAHLGALVDHLRLERAHLVVHDWGGPIGLGMARRRPDFVDRLVIMNTAGFPSRRIPRRIAICRLPVVGALLVRGLNGFSRAAIRMTTVRPLPAATRSAYLWPYQTWGDRVAIHAFVRDIPLEAGHCSLPEIEAIGASLDLYRGRPVLLLWGGQDWCFDDGFLSEWQRRLPEARAVRYSSAGHWVLEDVPDGVSGEVRAFLSQRGQGAFC